MFYGRPVLPDCPDVRTLPDVRHFHNRNIFTDVRNPPDVRHFHIRSILTDVRLRSDVRILYTGLWVTLFTAAGRPMTVGRPDLFVPPDVRRSPDVRPILYPKRSLLPTTYIYTFPFHGIRLTIHLEPIKNTPHSLSHSSTLNPRFPSVLGAFERSSPIK